MFAQKMLQNFLTVPIHSLRGCKAPNASLIFAGMYFVLDSLTHDSNTQLKKRKISKRGAGQDASIEANTVRFAQRYTCKYDMACVDQPGNQAPLLQ